MHWQNVPIAVRGGRCVRNIDSVLATERTPRPETLSELTSVCL